MGSSQSRPPQPPPSNLLEEPWSDANPFTEELTTFRKTVMAPTLYGRKKKYNILIAGVIQAGKSSYLNSLLTVTDENESRIRNASEVREADHTTTFQFHKYPLDDKINAYDMPGYDDENRFEKLDMNMYRKILDGKVPDKHDMRRDLTSCEEDPARKIDAVILVLDPVKMRSQHTAMLFYKPLLKACIERQIRFAVVLAKVDTLCDEAREDITKVYRSKKIKNAVEYVHGMLGPNRKYIIPIRNYVDETKRNPMMDKLLLHSLNITVQLAEDRAKYNSNDQRRWFGF